MIIAIDPGTTASAWAEMDGLTVHRHDLENNLAVLNWLDRRPGWREPPNVNDYLLADYLVIEMVASYGMPVGREVFETCVWIGRFLQAWGGPWEYVYRREVKSWLCQDSRAKDSNVRRAILDMYPPAGGGKTPQVGTKAHPGPLYGVSKDVWSAIGVGLTYQKIDPHACSIAAQGQGTLEKQ